MKQKFYEGIKKLNVLLQKKHFKKAFIVCDSSFDYLCIKNDILSINIPFVIFNKFSSNPLHDDVDLGVREFLKENCDVIIAIGGGSSLDVAKCIKLESHILAVLIAIPTTAGTGSESTKHIVVYRDGKKESISDENIIPNFVIFEPKVLESLPLYQKKCTMLDALCQGIESYWSINANFKSRRYSKKAIRLIITNKDKYIYQNDKVAASKIMLGANYSGRAINIAQTTAAHAMSYKITSMYKLPHGHAVGICISKVWRAMLRANCSDKLISIFSHIALLMDCDSIDDAILYLEKLIEEYNLDLPKVIENREKEIEILCGSVNKIRLKNNPILFDYTQLKEIYEEILN